MDVLEVRLECGERKVEFSMKGEDDKIVEMLISSSFDFLMHDKEAITYAEKGTEIEQPNETEKEKMEMLKEGYEIFKTDHKGLHHPKSEYKVYTEKKDLSVKEINGKKTYQTYYVCTGCNHKGKHYVPKGRIYVSCHECGKRMRVREATHGGFPEKDEFGNYYIAGDFRMTMADKENEIKLVSSI
jgi:hypothetical protein